MRYFTLVIMLAFACCNQVKKDNKNKAVPQTSTPVVAAPANCDYASRKTQCKKLFTINRNTANVNSNNKLTAFFADSLLQCWYGTPWDFNGCTTLPGSGKIACGYFITTTLQDAGLSINRIKMAQCPSSELIRYVCKNILTFSNKPIDDFIAAIKKSGYGLYITGLDFHTGFIYNDGKDVYFIHSSFYGSKCVVKEKAITSAVLKGSKLKMIGKINFS